MADKIKLPKEQWKPQFVSPGEAWMDHVERHHNAGAATPEYLKEKSQAVQSIEKAAQKYVDQIQKGQQEPQLDNMQDRAQSKDKAKDVNINIGR